MLVEDSTSALVERIETFRKARAPRTAPGDAPTLPMAELEQPVARKPIDSFNFGTNSEGRIDWAEPAIAPLVVGIDLSQRRAHAPLGGDFAGVEGTLECGHVRSPSQAPCEGAADAVAACRGQARAGEGAIAMKPGSASIRRSHV